MKVRIEYVCSRCGSQHFRPSISRRLSDPLLACVGVRPQRCYMCRVRFYLFQPVWLRAFLSALSRPMAVPAVEPSGSLPARNIEAQGRTRAMAAGAGNLVRHS